MSLPMTTGGGWDMREDPRKAVEKIPSDLVPTILERVTRRGRGGRQPAADPRTIPGVDPKRAKRIIANRESAARSKLKQKVLMETLKIQNEMQTKRRSELEELNLMRRVCQELKVQNRKLEEQVKLLETDSCSEAESDVMTACGTSASGPLSAPSSVVTAQGLSSGGATDNYVLPLCTSALKSRVNPWEHQSVAGNTPALPSFKVERPDPVGKPRGQVPEVVVKAAKCPAESGTSKPKGPLHPVAQKVERPIPTHPSNRALREHLSVFGSARSAGALDLLAAQSYALLCGLPMDLYRPSPPHADTGVGRDEDAKQADERISSLATVKLEEEQEEHEKAEHGWGAAQTGLKRKVCDEIEEEEQGRESARQRLPTDDLLAKPHGFEYRIHGIESHISGVSSPAPAAPSPSLSIPQAAALRQMFSPMPVLLPDGRTVQAYLPASSLCPPMSSPQGLLPHPYTAHPAAPHCTLQTPRSYENILKSIGNTTGSTFSSSAFCASSPATSCSRLQPRSIPRWY